jgi:hypothetical protein
MRLEEKTSDRDLSRGPLCGELDGTLKSWISVTPKLEHRLGVLKKFNFF